ncbi:MAG TPA: efflux transporter outer membrane subunit, partial [Alphaproteobacteria bacterium]|nr:efflux transporter outer membrane subunit [Alphaproteobacteria bacterium]
KNRSTLASARSLALASRYDRETIAITVLANVGITYFSVLEFRDRLAIARDNLANAESVLAIVEARVRNGAASALELAQQRTVVANQRAALPALEQQLRQAENALAVLLGETPDALTIASGSLDDITLPEVAPGLPSELLNRRPDIANAEAQLIAANADIGTARAALFPSIQLTAQGGYESTALSSLFNGPGLFWTLVASVTQPIFEGGRLAGQVDLTEARYEELVQTYRSTVINAFRDTEDTLVAIRQLAVQQMLQEEAVAAAQAAFDLADTRYRGGADTLLNVLDAQRTLFQARDQLVQIRSARLQAVVSLFRALGGGWRLP